MVRNKTLHYRHVGQRWVRRGHAMGRAGRVIGALFVAVVLVPFAAMISFVIGLAILTWIADFLVTIT